MITENIDLENDLLKANKIIKDCIKTKNTYLDLSFCNISNLQQIPLLFKATHIKTLILNNFSENNNYEDYNEKTKNLNLIQYLTKNITKLKNLTTLIIDNGFLIDKYFLYECNCIPPKYNNNLNYKCNCEDYNNNLNYECNCEDYNNCLNYKIHDISYIKYFSQLKKLKLIGVNLSDANFIKDLTNLKYLDISNNYITNINFLKNLKHLEYLNISFNLIKNFIPIKYLQNLKYLDIIDNNDYDDGNFYKKNTNYNSIGKLKNLKSLTLINFTKIIDYDFLKSLENLENLDMVINNIYDFKSLRNLTKLKFITIEASSSFSDNLLNIKKLRAYSNKNFSNLEDTPTLNFIKNLTQLKKIYLMFFNGDISFLKLFKNIEYLILEDSTIYDLSPLKKLKNLKSLNLNYSKHIDFKSLKYLTNLEKLELKSCRVFKTKFLKNFTNLKYLDLSNNYIININFLKNLKHLQYLDIANNQIKNLSSIKHLQNLKYLDISNNNEPVDYYYYDYNAYSKEDLDCLYYNEFYYYFKDIYDFYDNLNSLDFLFFKYYKYNYQINITNIKYLVNLEYLNLSNNYIIDISFIKNNKKLKYLDISNNNVFNIDYLNNCNQLRTLKLYKNNIKNIPEIIYKLKNWQEIVKHIFVRNNEIDILSYDFNN